VRVGKLFFVINPFLFIAFLITKFCVTFAPAASLASNPSSTNVPLNHCLRRTLLVGYRCNTVKSLEVWSYETKYSCLPKNENNKPMTMLVLPPPQLLNSNNPMRINATTISIRYFAPTHNGPRLCLSHGKSERGRFFAAPRSAATTPPPLLLMNDSED